MKAETYINIFKLSSTVYKTFLAYISILFWPENMFFFNTGWYYHVSNNHANTIVACSKPIVLSVIETREHLEHNSIHTGPRAAPPPPEALARLCHTYKIVGSSGEIVRAEHVERDPGLGVEVQPPLVHVLGEDQVKRVPGAPFLGGVHQLFELHPA